MEQQEDLDWIFVGKVPMLIEKKNIAKQQKIETWLDLYQLTKELGINPETGPTRLNEPISYVI